MGFGFSLPPEMIRKIEKRFTPPPVPGKDAPKGISFDRFLMACVTVKHYTEGFRRWVFSFSLCIQKGMVRYVGVLGTDEGCSKGSMNVKKAKWHLAMRVLYVPTRRSWLPFLANQSTPDGNGPRRSGVNISSALPSPTQLDFSLARLNSPQLIFFYPARRSPRCPNPQTTNPPNPNASISALCSCHNVDV